MPQPPDKRTPTSPPPQPSPPKTRAIQRASIDRVRDLLLKSRDALATALPRHIKAEYMIRVALTEIQRNPKLLDCTPRSLVGAIFQASQLGLSLDAQLGQAYLVPYKDQITLIPGYRGLIQLALRSGRVASINAAVVRKGDVFEWELGSSPKILHKPRLVEALDKKDLTSDFTAVYAIAFLKGGAQPQFVVMSRAQVQAIMGRSPAMQKQNASGPWITDPEAMWRKTPTRALVKWLPVETERAQAMVQAVTLDEQAEAGLSQNLDLMAPDGVVDDDGAPALDKLTEALQKGGGQTVMPLGGAELPDELGADDPEVGGE